MRFPSWPGRDDAAALGRDAFGRPSDRSGPPTRDHYLRGTHVAFDAIKTNPAAARPRARTARNPRPHARDRSGARIDPRRLRGSRADPRDIQAGNAARAPRHSRTSAMRPPSPPQTGPAASTAAIVNVSYGALVDQRIRRTSASASHPIGSIASRQTPASDDARAPGVRFVGFRSARAKRVRGRPNGGRSPVVRGRRTADLDSGTRVWPNASAGTRGRLLAGARGYPAGPAPCFWRISGLSRGVLQVLLRCGHGDVAPERLFSNAARPLPLSWRSRFSTAAPTGVLPFV
jgi:hypothetical protein